MHIIKCVLLNAGKHPSLNKFENDHIIFVFHKFSTPVCCIYGQVNDIAFHPVHGTLSTVGSDGRFSFWDKDARTKLKTSDQFDQPITTCAFNAQGNIFGYASSYDWSKVYFEFVLELLKKVP